MSRSNRSEASTPNSNHLALHIAWFPSYEPDIELNKRIETLQAKAEEIPAESKEEFNQMMQSLQSQKDVVAERLEALQSAPAEGWETLKSSTEEALNEMQQTYQKVANRFP